MHWQSNIGLNFDEHSTFNFNTFNPISEENMDRKSVLTQYIKDEIMRNRNADLPGDEDLLSTGVLDSLGILQLVGFIEETFDIEVPDEDVIYENFMSVEALVEYLGHY
jgi:acyl carrier protein